MFVRSRVPSMSYAPNVVPRRKLKHLFLSGVEAAFKSGELPARNHAWKAVYRAFIDMIGPDNRLFPSHATIATKAQVSERTVWAALNQLERIGLIQVTARYLYDPEKGKKVRTSNLYQIVTSMAQRAVAILAASVRKGQEAAKRQARATVRATQKVFHHLTATDAENPHTNIFKREIWDPQPPQRTQAEMLEYLSKL